VMGGCYIWYHKIFGPPDLMRVSPVEKLGPTVPVYLCRLKRPRNVSWHKQRKSEKIFLRLSGNSICWLKTSVTALYVMYSKVLEPHGDFV